MKRLISCMLELVKNIIKFYQTRLNNPNILQKVTKIQIRRNGIVLTKINNNIAYRIQSLKKILQRILLKI